MTLAEIEDAIVAQCELRRSQGWVLIRVQFGKVAERTCCPLNSFGDTFEDTFEDAREKFGWSGEKCWEFTDGVDGLTFSPRTEIYLLGVRVRERLGL